ncbi:glycosyltransferase family 39 protein [Mycolicibacterium sp. 018/SC-01/001]|uniref:ArnT family glycosyltransferase n=1 Tax=Mycolicibacterium sp. 018/SC-01/001 TaxID=2592069 RepID=UPI00117CB17F|nr:glycosyltransferase family 39 protein [Mycolicibacterium sp. 018/SC-01/001]TRW76972.1 glycosyltransferase family 39 protein [Mycolicibacterium sp. 018/SC-01/001]
MTTSADTAHRPAPPIGEEAQPDPRWARPSLAALLIATAVFWCVGLSRNGWANAFYSAAVQAGTKSWKAFLFGSSDAANVITVDKPPAALWPMEISARIFGVNTWSIQLPQVLLGVASVALLYVIVTKHFGPAAGLLAGAALALTPVATLMFRYNNPDALLTFLMIAAVWAVMRAVSDGRTRWLMLCGALLGLGFLTKQLQVLLVVPGLALAYLVAGPPRLRIRLVQLVAGLGGMVLATGWWVLLVELWPPDSRPYIGGSENNSFLDLTFGYNGLGRLLGGEQNRPGGGMELPHDMPSGMGGFISHAGITRMFTAESGAQISWLLPAALILLLVGVVATWRRPRTDHQRAQYLVWGGWLIGTAAVFSFMSGLFHDYYTVALAPAVAAVVGIGAADLWLRRDKRWPVAVLALVTAVTGGWSWILLSRTPEFVGWLRWVVVGLAALATAALLMTVTPRWDRRRVRRWAAAAAIFAALAGPLSYCVQTVSTSHTGGIITAGPTIAGNGFPGGRNPMQETTVSDAVAATLLADADTFTWVAAVPGSTDAGVYQLATDRPVMALGGFSSGDPAPTLEEFQQYVHDRRVHYFIESAMFGRGAGQDSDMPVPPGMDSDTQANRIKEWVKQNFTPVTVDGVTLYDLTQPLT